MKVCSHSGFQVDRLSRVKPKPLVAVYQYFFRLEFKNNRVEIHLDFKCFHKCF
jgi:hypothetical protein